MNAIRLLDHIAALAAVFQTNPIGALLLILLALVCVMGVFAWRFKAEMAPPSALSSQSFKHPAHQPKPAVRRPRSGR